MVCNGDEGDPGAFMDRSIMEGDPHKMIEGMVIAAYAVGATRATSTSVPIIRSAPDVWRAIAQAESWGLLGDHILGSGT